MANPLLQHAFTNAKAPLAAAKAAVNATVEHAAPLVQAANATAAHAGAAAQDAMRQGAEASPALMSGQDMWGGYFQALGAVFLLLGALYLGFYLLKRYGPKAGLRGFDRGGLKMEGQLALGPKKSINVVRFLNKRMVIGVTETHITLLTTIDADHHGEDTEFSTALDKAQKSDSSS